MLSQDRLRELLLYDPVYGVFKWRKTRGRVRAGQIAGKIKANTSYCSIRLDSIDYLAHRLAWFYVHGVWPEAFIDHINRNCGDNRLSNLRKANVSQNNANSIVRSSSTSGLKGVFRHGSVWGSRISINGKYKFLGYFDTALDAHQKYVDAAKAHFGEFARAA